MSFAAFCPRLRGRHGFTLVELIVVLLVMGSLTAISAVRYSGAKAHAVKATVQADLRNLMLFETLHFSEHGEFASPDDLKDISPSPGVRLTLTRTGPDTWLMAAAHQQSLHTCYSVVTASERRTLRYDMTQCEPFELPPEWSGGAAKGERH